MKMQRSNKKSIRAQRGATSLLIVVGLSMALIVIIGGLTALSIRESRQALDTDLSNRALAAAEAAATDGAQRLVDNPDIQVPNCNGDGSNLSSTETNNIIKPNIANAEIVCRTIINSATIFQQDVKKDQSTQYFTYLGNTDAGRATNMRLLWGNSSESISFSGTVFDPSNLEDTGTPATIELILVFWPRNATAGQVIPDSVGEDGFKTKNIVILPDPAGNTIVTCGGFAGDSSQATNKTYSCEAKVDLSSVIGTPATGQNIAVKVKSRYKDTQIQSQFFSANGYSNAVTVKSSKAIIDVTAKVGSIYRRIQAEKPIMPNSFFDDVMFSNSSICKNLIVKDNLSLQSANDCD